MAEKKELLLIEIREDGARVVKKNIQDLGKTGDATMNQMSKLQTVLAGLVSAKVIKDTILLADEYANMLNRLRVVTKGHEQLHAAMNAVFRMSRETRTALAANIDMYSRIALNTKRMGLGMKDVVRFATQLNHAIILSGVTAREAQWGMVQFSQGLAAGALRGDELRAVMEQLPIVTKTLTNYLGIGRGELRQWAFEGRVTTQVIIDAFNDAEKSLAERFGRRIPTVDQALTTLHNSLTKFTGDLDQAIQGTGSLARALLWASDNMDTIGRLIILVGTALGGLFLKNLISVIASMKLFNLAWVKTLQRATLVKLGILGVAAVLVTYSDKIKIANDSTATLADFLAELGKNAKVTYGLLRDAIGSLLDTGDVQTQYAGAFEMIVTDAAKAVDALLGVFVGFGQVLKKIFFDIPGYAKIAWNGILTGIETVKDVIVGVFRAIGDAFKIFGLNMKTAVISLSASMKQILAGNIDEATRFADQAALSLKNAVTQGFGNMGSLIRNNIEEATKEDSLAGAKFNIEKSGETLGEAFMRGFGMSNLITSGITDMLDRAKAAAATRAAGGAAEDGGAGLFTPTPTQMELLKDMLGDVGKVNNEMMQLRELWHAINTEKPGTEGMDITLDLVNRKMTELRIKSLETSTGVVDGFKRGFMQMTLEMSNFADMAEKTIVNAFSSMEDALVQFVTTGKVDFKSLVDSMLADLTRLLARQALMGLLNSLAGGGGIMGALAGSLGGQAAGTAGAAAGAAGSAVPRANGGPVSPGMSYMVGERGRPELFTPAQPGHITPTPQMIQPQVSEGDVVIINVASEEEAIAAMQSHEGKRVIRNEIRTYRDGRS